MHPIAWKVNSRKLVKKVPKKVPNLVHLGDTPVLLGDYAAAVARENAAEAGGRRKQAYAHLIVV
jgi:hypothetical protein